MIERHRILLIVAVAAMVLPLYPAGGQAEPASARPHQASGLFQYGAGDRDHWKRHDPPRHSHRRDRDRRNALGGTYVGNLYGYRDPGNGNYFYIEGYGGSTVPYARGMRAEPPGAKIIIPELSGSACSNEDGVCVIRPR